MTISRLKEYKAKRNFRRTTEPAGVRRRKPATGGPLFVVQKHAATRLHYDFRLAMEGVLKSWAVPKGFPTKKGDRRLAVQVEDHPMDYARFEGTIPEGNYGAGTVMVWDIGSFEVMGGNPIGALKSGKLHLVLKGKKLRGEWTLVRMRPGEHDDKPQWLLLKSESDIPPISARADDQSVLTKRSMERIASENKAQWQSNRATDTAHGVKGIPVATKRRGYKPKRLLSRPSDTLSSAPSGGEGRGEEASRKLTDRRTRRKPGPVPDSVGRQLATALSRLPKRKAEFFEPMKARLVDKLPKGEDWIYELKFDGVRALAIKRKGGVELVSRNAKDFTRKYPGVVAALESLPHKEAILDGEIVALDADGKSSFQLLQSANLPGGATPPIFYYVFDAVQLEGRDLTGLPLLERKKIARALAAALPETIRFSAGIEADSERVLNEMKERGLEGLIAKQKHSKYEIGGRSGAWMKFKWTNEQEFVIGGYTPPKGTRAYFGAILVGYYERGKLRFASKVGTGFDQKLLKSLSGKFSKLTRQDCPFVNLPEKTSAGGRGGLMASEMRRCTWLEPKLVCQIRFGEWTRDHHLRQPAFMGLREDKDPKEVVREKA